ncbi:MAG TPA: hypothetical protein VFA59_06385 [Vicinamibacterales bacterium]|nr:hypothetical protein [Vicinamibacterales bacterium]
MTRTATGFCVAAALSLAVSVGAQTTTSPQTTTTPQPADRMRSDKGAHDVTVIGCLARGADGNYTLNNARMNDAMSNRSRTSSNPDTTTAGTTGSTTASTTEASATTAGNSMSWKLEGGHDLDKHVGHKVEVTGHTEWNGSSSASTTSSTTSTTTEHNRDSMSGPRLDVSSVKMISTSCQ